MSVEDVDDDTMRDVTRHIEQLAFRLGRRRREGAGYASRSHGDYLPRSPVVGEASPLSPRLDWERVDEDGRVVVVGRGSFGAAYEGPPSFVHGGWIACAFDELLGIANIESGNPGMTARLTVHYRADALFHDLVIRAWVDRVEGRRIMSRAAIWDGDTITAEADGIFVQPRAELAEKYFGPRDDA